MQICRKRGAEQTHRTQLDCSEMLPVTLINHKITVNQPYICSSRSLLPFCHKSSLPSPIRVSRWAHPPSSSSRSGWVTSVRAALDSESEPWRTERVRDDESASLGHPSVRPQVFFTIHTPYLIRGFSAPASAEVIFKLNAPRKGTGVEIKFSGSQRFWRPRQHKDSGAAETQSLALV